MATAIPTITDEFNSVGDIGWYGSAYLFTTCSLTLVYGKLYTFYSTKWVYLIAIAIFEAGSIICGAAPNSVGLIIGRAIAGLGGGGMYSGSMLIISQSMPLEKRPIFTGIISGLYGIAGVAGPLLGGAFTEYVSWRWCFYINAPLGGVTMLFILFFLKAPRPIQSTSRIQDQIAQLDLIGLVFFMPAIVSILLALQWGGTEYSWESGQIIGLFVAFGVLISIFISIQWWKQDTATVSPRLVKNRNICGAALYCFCLTGSFIVFIYYVSENFSPAFTNLCQFYKETGYLLTLRFLKLPLWFQSIKHATATNSGLMNLPMILGVFICTIVSSIMVSTFGYYMPFMYAAPILASVGAGLLTTLRVDSGYSQWIGYQSLYGIGLGLGMSQPMIVVQAVLPPIDVPTGTAIITFMQSIGGALFIAVAQNVFNNMLLCNLAEDAPNVDASKVAAAGATMLTSVVPVDMLPLVLEAYNTAITQAFHVGVALAAIACLWALPLQWVSVKGKKSEPIAARS